MPNTVTLYTCNIQFVAHRNIFGRKFPHQSAIHSDGLGFLCYVTRQNHSPPMGQVILCLNYQTHMTMIMNTSIRSQLFIPRGPMTASELTIQPPLSLSRRNCGKLAYSPERRKFVNTIVACQVCHLQTVCPHRCRGFPRLGIYISPDFHLSWQLPACHVPCF